MKHQQQRLIFFIIGFFLIYILYLFGRALAQSLFFVHKDRINLVVYGPYTAVFSLGSYDGENYVINFPADTKVEVPGGYSLYRVGSLGKLVALERKPDIFRKTFSLATASFVDYYFYPQSVKLYYDIPEVAKADLFPQISQFILLKSNANLFDRIYILITFSQRSKERFRLVSWSGRGGNFFKENQGLLYQHVFREEKKKVQLIYKNTYHLAEGISIILEGNGIRVSDITQNSSQLFEGCSLFEEGTVRSKTSQAIADFFHCRLFSGSTGVYDIIFNLGSLEEEWEMSKNN